MHGHVAGNLTSDVVIASGLLTGSGMPSEVPRELAQGMKRSGLPLTPQARRRALVLLASCPDGCTEAILAAHNIPAEIVAKLLRKGLATAGAERVGRVRINLTDEERDRKKFSLAAEPKLGCRIPWV